MTRRITDLSLTIEEGMQTFPCHWHPFVEITQLGRHGIEDRETRKIVLGTHTGTHIDAPRHFIAGGETVENLPLDALVGPASVADFTVVPLKSAIDEKELAKAVGDGPVERVILRFDWDAHLGTNAYYTDHAWLTEGASQWLVDQGCRVLAMDTPQPDNPENGKGSENDAPNHKILLGAGVILVEYLTNLRELRAAEVELVVAPLKIREGDGAPARVFAIENE